MVDAFGLVSQSQLLASSYQVPAPGHRGSRAPRRPFSPFGNQCGKCCVHHSMQCVGTLSWSVVGLVAPPANTAQGVRLRIHPAPRAAGDGAGPGSAAIAPAAPRRTLGGGSRGAQASRIRARGGTDPWRSTGPKSSAAAWTAIPAHGPSWFVPTIRRVYGLCYRFTGNAADAEDLTQDVFLKIYSNLSSFDTARGSLQVWITTMTRNLLVDNFRRTRNQRATGLPGCRMG